MCCPCIIHNNQPQSRKKTKDPLCPSISVRTVPTAPYRTAPSRSHLFHQVISTTTSFAPPPPLSLSSLFSHHSPTQASSVQASPSLDTLPLVHLSQKTTPLAIHQPTSHVDEIRSPHPRPQGPRLCHPTVRLRGGWRWCAVLWVSWVLPWFVCVSRYAFTPCLPALSLSRTLLLLVLVSSLRCRTSPTPGKAENGREGREGVGYGISQAGGTGGDATDQLRLKRREMNHPDNKRRPRTCRVHSTGDRDIMLTLGPCILLCLTCLCLSPDSISSTITQSIPSPSRPSLQCPAEAATLPTPSCKSPGEMVERGLGEVARGQRVGGLQDGHPLGR